MNGFLISSWSLENYQLLSGYPPIPKREWNRNQFVEKIIQKKRKGPKTVSKLSPLYEKSALLLLR
jgi:hypothetical protein